MVYIITYDLNKPGQNYNELYEAIKKIGDWIHPLDSNWLVETDITARQISNRLKEKIDKNDSLLVIKVTKDHAGWLPDKVWNWLNNADYS